MVASLGSAVETLDVAREGEADVVVLDVALPGMNGVECVRRLQKEVPSIRVLALSMHRQRRLVLEMLRAGAAGYILKDCSVAELALAVRVVAEGKHYISPSLAAMVTREALRGYRDESAFDLLTEREREVLQLLSEGFSAKQIGTRLCLSPKTVQTHRQHVMEKLQLNSVAELTKYAIREGLTALEL